MKSAIQSVTPLDPNGVVKTLEAMLASARKGEIQWFVGVSMYADQAFQIDSSGANSIFELIGGLELAKAQMIAENEGEGV